jgi:hypothetical protein
MSLQTRNLEGDRRAASLTLRPRPQQRNTIGRGFELRTALTDMDHVERNRILQCIAIRNKK